MQPKPLKKVENIVNNMDGSAVAIRDLMKRLLTARD